MGPFRNGEGSEFHPDKIIDDMIAGNTVAIFSKTYCPYCKSIKDFFKGHGIEFQTLELDIMGQQGKDIQGLTHKSFLLYSENDGNILIDDLWHLSLRQRTGLF